MYGSVHGVEFGGISIVLCGHLRATERAGCIDSIPRGLVTSSLDVGRRLRLAVDRLRRMLYYS